MSAREPGQNVVDRIDAGRRAASRVLTMLDLGLDPVAVVRELCPDLSPLAVQAAAQLAQLTSFDYSCLAIVLAGLADNSVLEVAEIPSAPPRLRRPSPDEVAAAWPLGPTSLPGTPEKQP